MLETLAAVVFVGVTSSLIGQALCCPSGTAGWSPLAPGVGFAALIVLASLAVRLPGRSITSLALIVLATAAAAGWLWRRIDTRPPALWALPVTLTTLAASIPFLSNGRVGLLGVSFNNDLANHLIWTEGLRSVALAAVHPVPTFYPLGPHALVASLSAAGIETDAGFVAVLMAVPVLTALAALAALDDVPTPLRLVLAPLVGLPYLGAAYYAQGAFKETIQALLVALFALVLRDVALRPRRAPIRAALQLGLIVAAAVFNYSYYGLVWFLAIAATWMAFELGWMLLRGSRAEIGRAVRALVVPTLVAAAVTLVALVPELPRIIGLFDELAVSPSRSGAIEVSNIGNLAGPISPFETLGIWVRDDFRFAPSHLFRAGMLSGLALGVAVFGGLWWLRRRDTAVPAAVAVCALVYLFIRARGESPYVVAKALVVPAPLIMLMGTRALLSGRARDFVRRDGHRLRLAVAAVFVVTAIASSLLVLRSALVGPGDHGSELASLRSKLEGRSTLFLGYDDFFAWELRGVPVSSPIAQSRFPVQLRPEKPWAYGEPLDFDSVQPAYLDHFAFVITTATGYASRPPPNFRPVRSTRSYRVWQRFGPTPSHEVLAEDPAPGVALDCRGRNGRRLSRRKGNAIVMAPPVLASGPPGLLAGTSATVPVNLPAGWWDLSVQYTSVHPVSVEAAGGERFGLPANLDRPGPFWPLGRVKTSPADSRRGLRISVATEALIDSPAHVASFGQIVALPAEGGPAATPLRTACGRYVDWYKLEA